MRGRGCTELYVGFKGCVAVRSPLPTFGFQGSNMSADLKASIFTHVAISLAQEHLSAFKD